MLIGLDNLQNGTKGDLHIIFTVKYPTLKNLSKKDSELLKVLLAKTEEEEVDNETKNETPPNCTQQ